MPINAWSIEDVRAAEAEAMAQLPEGELMDRAARGLAAVVEARLPDLPEHARIVVLAGSGGNGGDALFAGAYLAERADSDGHSEPTAGPGRDVAGVAAVLLGERVHEPAREAAQRAGVVLIDATSADGRSEAHRALAEADLVIDGIAGIGGHAGLAPTHALAWELVESIPAEAYVVAVDLPSGTDPGGERVVTDSVWADETVTFGVPKPVHVLAGAPACGLLTVVDIGLAERGRPSAARLIHDDIAAFWPVPGPTDDKYSRGVLGVVAGGENYTGAALLSVTAAVCAGVGMVRYVGPAGPSALVRAQVPEAVHGAGHVQGWLVGPGLDPAPEEGDAAGQAQLAAARAALDSDLPCVVDAGGLDALEGPRRQAGARTLLTPHAGELARLLGRIEGSEVDVAAVRAEPVAHARRAARLLHATVLLKGSTTYVVPPVNSLPVLAQADAPAWLGTAGSGDVLAGLAGMLLASGLDPLHAGALAALVHGLAGQAANPDGPVRALGVAHAIPGVVASAMRRRRGRVTPS